MTFIFLHCALWELCSQSQIKQRFSGQYIVAIYVIKELVHAFSCVYIELWMHVGSLESTQEA